MSNNPLVSIVRVVKNDYPSLKVSFPLISRQKTDFGYEVIVIDSGSTDGSVQYVSKLTETSKNVFLHRIAPDEFHHAKTRNLGVSMARGKFIAFLGGDAIPSDESWLANLVRPLLDGQTARVAATYGRQAPRPDADLNNIVRMTFNYPDVSRVKQKSDRLSNKELYFFSTVSCCINREMTGLPLFDENVPIFEDLSFSFKIINAGMKIIYCSDAIVIHSHNHGNIDVLRRYFDAAVVWEGIGVFNSSECGVKREEAVRYFRHAMKMLKGRKIEDYTHIALFLFCAYAGLKLGQKRNAVPYAIRKQLGRFV